MRRFYHDSSGVRADLSSARHLPAYLDEMEFRYNNRKNPYLFRDTLLKLIGAESLPYQQLVSNQT